MPIVKFSSNWNNKLDSTFFTTLRLDKSQFEVGKKYDISLFKDGEYKPLKRAECIAIKRITFDKINDYIAGMDTGYGVDDAKRMLRRMYKNKVSDWSTQVFIFPLFKTVA